eukprot:GHVH01001815.1.p1 GENE.GHVH01001815.1~~GHVH01001815.1.p1  ORF type:complete len:392 (-),score=34.66 GHVH01001815.1:787-1962(-)
MNVLTHIRQPTIGQLTWSDLIRSTVWYSKRYFHELVAWKSVWLSFLVHICIGAPYGWCIATPLFVRRIGVVAKHSADEWDQSIVTVACSLSFLTMDILQGQNKRFVNRVGTRIAVMAGGFIMGIAYFTIGHAVMVNPEEETNTDFEDLIKIHVGFILMGVAMSLCYLPSLQNAVSHHPDCQGLVSGIVVGGFGAAALVFSPTFESLIRLFHVVPRFVSNGELQAVMPGAALIVPSAEDLAVLPYKLLNESTDNFGYMPGTGYNGLTPSLWSIGLMYSSVMITCGFFMVDHVPSSLKDAPPPPFSKRKLLRDTNFRVVVFLKVVASVAITATMCNQTCHHRLYHRVRQRQDTARGELRSLPSWYCIEHLRLDLHHKFDYNCFTGPHHLACTC